MSINASIKLERGNFRLDVTLELPAQGITALFGRSGSGKTTVLRCIAGLERTSAMHLRVNGQIWQDKQRFLPVHQRPLGYVFQEASLFPHLNVERNLQFGYSRVAKAQRQIGFNETVELLGLQTLLTRYPEQLSGGQRQRVAIARALLTSPQLLLMDEPMASLDHTSKAEILPYIERLHANLGIPIIYVSHAIEEVSRLADHLVLLEQGQVLAAGPLQDILTRTDLPLAHSANAAAVIKAKVLSHADDFISELQLADGQSVFISQQNIALGSEVRARVLARDVAIALEIPQQFSVNNCLTATLLEISDDPNPGHVLLKLQLGDQVLLSRISRRSLQRMALKCGQQVYALVKAVSLDL